MTIALRFTAIVLTGIYLVVESTKSLRSPEKLVPQMGRGEDFSAN